MMKSKLKNTHCLVYWAVVSLYVLRYPLSIREGQIQVYVMYENWPEIVARYLYYAQYKHFSPESRQVARIMTGGKSMRKSKIVRFS